MNSTRIKLAEAFRQATPMGPAAGPPLPEGLNINWPSTWKYKLPKVVSDLGFGYYGARDKVFYIIRGQ